MRGDEESREESMRCIHGRGHRFPAERYGNHATINRDSSNASGRATLGWLPPCWRILRLPRREQAERRRLRLRRCRRTTTRKQSGCLRLLQRLVPGQRVCSGSGQRLCSGRAGPCCSGAWRGPHHDVCADAATVISPSSHDGDPTMSTCGRACAGGESPGLRRSSTELARRPQPPASARGWPLPARGIELGCGLQAPRSCA